MSLIRFALLAFLLSQASRISHGMLLSSREGGFDDLTCVPELLGEAMWGTAERQAFSTEEAARQSVETLGRGPKWVSFANNIYSSGTCRDLKSLHGRMVVIIRRTQNPASLLLPYERVVGLFLSSLHSGSFYWPGQTDEKDSLLVLGRENLHRIPAGEVVAIYRGNGKAVSIAPRFTGNPLIDAVPSRALNPDTVADGENTLEAAKLSLSHLPLLGYKKLVFNPDDEPQSVQEFLEGKILAGVCHDIAGDAIVIFAGRITKASSRIAAYGWRDRPETYDTPTAWGVTVFIDGSFGPNQGINFSWCKSLWIHDGTAPAAPTP